VDPPKKSLPPPKPKALDNSQVKEAKLDTLDPK